MPVGQLYRTPMQGRLEYLYQRFLQQARKECGPDVKLPFCVYLLKACLVLNPYYEKVLSRNFSFLEGVGGYIGRFLLLANGQPDRNITYYFNRRIMEWNTDDLHNITRKIVRSLYDFETTTKPTRMNPEGITNIISYRIIQPLRGDDVVDLLQQDQDQAAAGIALRRGQADQSRDTNIVDVSIVDLLRRYGL